jgi:hypothetical protein
MSIFVCSFDEQVFGLDIDIATITYIGDIDIRLISRKTTLLKTGDDLRSAGSGKQFLLH